MSTRFPYRSGCWLVICDRCQRQFYNTDLRPDGEKPNLMVCSDCWDPKHPLSEMRTVPTVKSVPWARPQKAEVSHFEDSDDYANRITKDSYPKSW